MIKILAFSLWAIVATLGVAYLQIPSQSTAEQKEKGEPLPVKGQTHTFSVALLEKGELVGHLVTRIAYEMKEPFPAGDTIPLKTIMEDATLDVVSRIGAARFRKVDEALLKDVGAQLVTRLNEGTPAIPVRSAELMRTELMMRK